MRKMVVVVGSLVLGVALVATGVVVYGWLQPAPAPSDRTSNINQLLTRPSDWQPISDQPVVSETQLTMIDGSTATVPITAELLRQFYGFTDEQVERSELVWHSTTHQAYINLIDRVPRLYDFEPLGASTSPATSDQTVDLILVTPPSAEETAYAAQRGVELDITAVAKDAFVFITHRDNPVDSLTLEQVRAIYSGQITNWNQVGGPDRVIEAYQREANSGSQTAMEQIVMQGQAMVAPIETQVAFGMGTLVDAVAEFGDGPGAIGYTYDYYIQNLYRNDNVKRLAIDGVAPTAQTIADGSYPLVTSYDVIIRADEPSDSPARKLRDFLMSPTGQAIVAQAGYVKAVG